MTARVPDWLKLILTAIGVLLSVGAIVWAAGSGFASVSAKVDGLGKQVDLRMDSTNEKIQALDKRLERVENALISTADAAAERVRIESVIRATVKPEALR